MIAVVVPTIREDSYRRFLDEWSELFEFHNVQLIVIKDGDEPIVISGTATTKNTKDIMGGNSDLIFNKNDGVRNLGFALIAQHMPEVEYIITLDDDCYPIRGSDPIQDHIDALNIRVPVSWMSTASHYMRGFPYAVRKEAEVVLSHGIWEGVPDYDAPTQLMGDNYSADFEPVKPPLTYYKGPIPKNTLFPMCIMNVAFKRKMLPYMYQAPMGVGVGLDRFADIWSGIHAKRAIDEHGWAAVTGYSTIHHSRASDVFVNLKKEAKGIGLNETYWSGDESDPYFKLYEEKRNKWKSFIERALSETQTKIDR